jgi:hypothetical protein
MNKFKFGLKALALALAVNAGAIAFAQDATQAAPGNAQSNSAATACGAAVVADSQSPNYGGYPYEYPEDGGGVNAAPPEPPKPQNPVRKVCEDGKIEIRLGNSRHFGYRIGDRIPLVVLVSADEKVKIDFTSLKQEVLGFEGSDFELAAPAVVRSQKLKDGRVLYRVDLTVVTWVPKDNVVFNLDLRYATDLAADGKTPNFKRLTTPDFVVSRSWTADNGEALLEGDLESKPEGSSWALMPVMILGFFLLGLFPGMELVKWINRIRPRKVMPPKAAAWKILDKIFADTRANGFKPDHYKQIASAFRRYLGAVKGVPIEPATFLEVRDRLEGDPELPKIESVLTKCERVIYHGATLADEENRELLEEIEQLVPRPWEQR